MLPMPSLPKPTPAGSEFRVRSDIIVRSPWSFQKIRSSWVPRTLPPTFLVFPRKSMGSHVHQGRTHTPCMSRTGPILTTGLSQVSPHRDPHPTCFREDLPLTHLRASLCRKRSRHSRVLYFHVVACSNALNILSDISVHTPWSVRSNVLCAGSVSLVLIT